ncbi:MAG: dTMP kinase [Bacteroidales bacterium]|nr:dTMP kinase [Bacteroidales bacterium]
MNLIVIEGLDGAGKSTQIKLLQSYFDNIGTKNKYLHFPRTDEPFFGELISRFLRGEFGNLSQVNPYLVAMLYAGDRKDAAKTISGWMSDGYYVLLDRYTYSNIAYQCAKLDDPKLREELKNWIFDLEFNYFGIPRPSLNIFLDVPFKFTKEKLLGDRNGNDRTYLQGNNDIHESSMNFQRAVREIYIGTAESDVTLEIIDCSDNNEKMLPPESIFKLIKNLLTKRGVL